MSTKITVRGISTNLLGWAMPIATAAVAGLVISPLLTPGRADAATSVGAISSASGTVWVKPSNSSQYYAAPVGTTLYVGDLIWPDAGSEVILECSSGKKLRVPSGVPSGVTNICPLPQSEDTGI
ncbi:hypothetical protein [[Phormidium] sp. ETS-05]|uniref:hypothetical protein n=1 Tax=[Phormidium] sp. ETS-05 TaxID=222819 RepID=UPI0018EECC10|nr:hypothetical protein [[Phormidium] sp. ETS-05]